MQRGGLMIGQYIKKQQERLYAFRMTYNVGRAIMAEATTELTERAITSYELEARRPTTSGMLSVALAYGLSMDYVMGISDVPYTKASLRAAMQKYREDYGEGISVKRNVKYSNEALGNIIALKRFLNTKASRVSKETPTIQRLQKDLKTVVSTGRAVYRLQDAERETEMER